MIVDLMLSFNHSVHRASAERRHSLWPRSHPPVHQIKMMAVLVYQAAARFAFVLNPVARLFLKGAAKFPRPNHPRLSDRAAADQIFDLLEIRGVAQFMTH